MNLNYFNKQTFASSIQHFFKDLSIPISSVAEKPFPKKEFFKEEVYSSVKYLLSVEQIYLPLMINSKSFQEDLFESKINLKDLKPDYDGIFIFGIEIKKQEKPIPLSDLANITRAISREMKNNPVVVFFLISGKLSIANCERTPYKVNREGEKPGKVSILRDIDVEKPHAGHSRILDDLSIAGKGIKSFRELNEYWLSVFDTSILNKKFYKDIANWYFWALKKVSFPFELSKDSRESKKDLLPITLIRFLTRLIFVWFLKEKKLIPDSLFDEKILTGLVEGFSVKGKKTLFYTSILQNLFFGTLNTYRNGDETDDSLSRKFRNPTRDKLNRTDDYMVTNLYRYESNFKDKNKILDLLKDVPFLNGGLFECLDKRETKEEQETRLDCFSDIEKKQPNFPDYLFFSEGNEIDLSDEYGDKKRNSESVNGIIRILDKYKFTVEENTPLEEEVALDPELLGKVFENLLASFNPETSTTARKQTGSFYTPREIVNYMVEESLVAYYKEALASPPALSKGEGANAKNDSSFGWQTANVERWEELKKYSREMRKEPTKAEELLWQELRNRKLDYKFRRQHAISSYIADFVCLEQNLIIEVDGEIHQLQRERDEARTKVLNSLGFSVLRFTNEEIFSNLDKVIQEIKSKLPNEKASPSPLERARGEANDHTTQNNSSLEQKLRSLLSSSDTKNPFNEDETELLVRATGNAKILDPACGSGAFPMGVLHKMVYVLRKLDPENKRWKQEQLDRNELEKKEIEKRIDADIETVSKLNSKDVKKKAIAELEEKKKSIEINFREHEADYARKLYLIENCIYGVDIQPIAVQITKLRFFISLIVDQKMNPTHKNLGIIPLPNLETKFVAANTLVGLEKPDAGELLSKKDSILLKLENELNVIRKKYFYSRSRSEKIKLKQDDKALRDKILEHFLSKNDKFKKDLENILKIGRLPKESVKEIFEYIDNRESESASALQQLVTQLCKQSKTDSGISKKAIEECKRYFPPKSASDIASWDPYNQNSHADWFDPEHMFGVASPPALSEREGAYGGGAGGGFDVVIGNPPYVQLQKDGGRLAKQYEKQGYETFTRMGDLYSLFYEEGIYLLNPTGHLCFITSNKWMRADYGKYTRKFFAEKTNPLLLIDFGQHQVFENATVDTNILVLSASPPALSKGVGAMSMRGVRIESDFKRGDGIREYVESKQIILENLSEEAWVVGDYAQMHIKKRVEEQGKKLKDWDIQIYRGVLTGYNEAFIIDGKIKDELIKKDKKNAKIIKPMLRGRDIQRWTPEFADLWLIGTFPSLNININEYPEIKKYLLSFGKKRLEQSGEPDARKKTGNDWFETQDQIGYYKEFDKPKIIFPNMSKFLPFIYDENKFYSNQKGYIITGNYLKYLTAFLNSSLFKFCFSNNFPELQGGTRELSKVFFEQIPVKIPTPAQEMAFNVLVDCILFALTPQIASDGRKYVSTFESVIDAMVVDLYFPDDLKKADCYILDRIVEKAKPFKADDTDDFKKQYVEKLYEFCLKDKLIYHGLIFRRNVEVVKTIYGGGKDG